MTPRTFSGIIPPMVTPLVDRDAIDHAGLKKLVEHMIGGGVNGLFVLGTTGEAPSLSYRLRRELITEVCRLVNGRVPVLVGITDTSFIESVHLANFAAEAGATALVLATPYYFPAGQTELLGYVENLVKLIPLPLMLYNMPSLTKVWFELDTLKRLTQLDRIVGIKDSSGDLEYFGRLISLRDLRPDWSILIGPEAMLPNAMQMGGDGGVAGGGNVFPGLFAACYRAAVDGNDEQTSLLSGMINELQSIYDIGKYASRYIKATKCALSLLDICDDFMAEPFHRFHAPDRERLRNILLPLSERIRLLKPIPTASL